MKLTDSDLQIMELFWTAQKPLSSLDILEQSPKEKKWKDNSIYIMIQTLQRKNAIREIGAVKSEKGKYVRVFEPVFSRQEYAAKNLTQGLQPQDVPALFSAMMKTTDISRETLDELEDMLRRKRMELK